MNDYLETEGILDALAGEDVAGHHINGPVLHVAEDTASQNWRWRCWPAKVKVVPSDHRMGMERLPKPSTGIHTFRRTRAYPGYG